MDHAADLLIGEDGWCSHVTRHASPNYDARPAALAIDLLVIHNISLPPGQYATGCVTDLFLNTLDCDAHPYFDQLRGLQVSSHFLILRTGEILQFVSTLDRAWHAGVSTFAGKQGCNAFSIGIELEGTDTEPFTDAQYGALSRLTAAIRQRHPVANIVGHEDIAPGRKTDPGPCFDWSRYQADVMAGNAAGRLASARFPFVQG